MLIFAEPTPNPDALKFLPHVRLTDGRGWSFIRGRASPVASPLAETLLQLSGVARVFVGEDFVTVTRAPDGEAWTTLRLQVVAAIADVLGEGLAAVTTTEPDTAAATSDLEREIREVLERHVRPGVARDGGDIVFERLDEAGVLWVRMEGACGGCPSSRRTLSDAVERIVRRFVPEVTAVAEVVGVPDPSRRPPWQSLFTRDADRPSAPRGIFRHNGRPFRS